MGPEIRAKRSTYAGLFLVTTATLMYEVLLTRIFSVTMFYHFAFVAISVAIVRYDGRRAHRLPLPRWVHAPSARTFILALSALLFAVTIVVSLAAHLEIAVRDGPHVGRPGTPGPQLRGHLGAFRGERVCACVWR